MSFQASAFAFLFPGSAMTNSILATAYISIFPNLLLYFVPPDINTGSLNVLVSFAVGKSLKIIRMNYSRILIDIILTRWITW